MLGALLGTENSHPKSGHALSTSGCVSPERQVPVSMNYNCELQDLVSTELTNGVSWRVTEKSKID